LTEDQLRSSDKPQFHTIYCSGSCRRSNSKTPFRCCNTQLYYCTTLR